MSHHKNLVSATIYGVTKFTVIPMSEVLGLCIFHVVHKFTSFLMTSIIKPVRVTHKIFRSCFLCAVAQLTHFLGNNIIKALASDVIVAGLYTVKCRCSPVCCRDFLKHMLFQHHSIDGSFSCTLLSRYSIKHQTECHQRCDMNCLCTSHFTKFFNDRSPSKRYR